MTIKVQTAFANAANVVGSGQFTMMRFRYFFHPTWYGAVAYKYGGDLKMRDEHGEITYGPEYMEYRPDPDGFSAINPGDVFCYDNPNWVFV